MKNFKIIFVHGYTASSKADWYPAISSELDRLGVDYDVPDLPGGRHPKSQTWISVIHNKVCQTDKPLVFVGHSLGSRAVLMYLQKYPTKTRLTLLVAAFANSRENAKPHYGETYSDFFESEIDLDKIKPLVNSFIVMHSKDDDSIPYVQGVQIAKDLGAKLLTYNDREHLSGPENAKSILEVLRNELNF